jgi:hypothetical protein
VTFRPQLLGALERLGTVRGDTDDRDAFVL